MIALQFVIVAIISLMTAKGSQSAEVTGECINRYPARQHQCLKAINTIKLENGKLPGNEKEIWTIWHNCSLIIYNAKLFKDITPDQIKEAVIAHFKQCPNRAGTIALPSNKEVRIDVRVRAPVGSQWEGWNADAPLNKAFCFKPRGALAIDSSEDCIKAYTSIEPDSAGFITASAEVVRIQSDYGTCRVIIYAPDQAGVKMSKKEADGPIIAMIKKCNKLPGVVNVNGAVGINGRIFVKALNQHDIN